MIENQDNEGQQQTDKTVSIPREYVLEGIKDVVASMHKMLGEAREKYGDRYNKKNEYEECIRRFDLDDTEATLKEYDLIMAKQSKQPSVVRGVIKQIGENAFHYAIIKYLRETGTRERQEGGLNHD